VRIRIGPNTICRAAGGCPDSTSMFDLRYSLSLLRIGINSGQMARVLSLTVI
jgi:hypothetical protein